MPDIGGFRRRFADQAKQVAQQASQVAQQASQAGLQHIEQFSANLAPPGTPQSEVAEAGATDADVAEEVSRLRAFLESRRPPPGPVRGRWSIGIGDLLAEHPRVPSAAGGLVRNLDRYGGLAITERTIEFDHDAIEWASVTEIRTRNVVEYLLSDALIQQIQTLPLPWFPGRRRVLEALSKALLTMVVAAAHEQLDRHADIRIPAEVEYRGAIRRGRQLSPGILAALMLADPAVNDCVTATAQAHGISVRPADDDVLNTAGEHAQQLRAKLGTLESKLGRGPGETTDSPAAEAVSDNATRPLTPPGSSRAEGQGRTIYKEFGIPDPGEILVQVVGELAGERVAAAVAGEVQRRRRADGSLVAADMSAFKKEKHSPLNQLGGLFFHEKLSVSVWAEFGFGMTQRRSARRQVEEVWENEGLDAAAQWALANAKHPLRLASLTDSLEENARHPFGHLEETFRRELVKDIRKWK